MNSQILVNEISKARCRKDGNPIREPGDYFNNSIMKGKFKYFNRFAYLEYLDQIERESYCHAMNYIFWFFYGNTK
jgi:hypothetical protein